MKIVADTDILSTFARIRRLDILKRLFKQVIMPPSVRSELKRGEISISILNPLMTRLTRDELKALRKADTKLGRGESECFVIAKSRGIPLASNESIVHSLCRAEGIGYLSLPRLLRLSILEKVISGYEARQLVKLIEREENTVIKDKEEIFK